MRSQLPTRKARYSFLFWALVANVFLADPILAASSDQQICAALPTHLIPLHISKAKYGEEANMPPPGGDRPRDYVGHAFVYTQFEMRNGTHDTGSYVVATGHIFEPPDAGSALLNPTSLKGVLAMSRAHFCQAGWIQGHTTDFYGSTDPLDQAVEQGVAAIDPDNASGPKAMIVRVAEFGGHLYFIAAGPRTVVAEISYPQRSEKKTVRLELGGKANDFTGYDWIIRPPRLINCRQSIGDRVARVSAKFWRTLENARATKGTETCEP